MSKTTRTRVGEDYEILEELGRGGMAAVYKARDKRLGRAVALKVLPPHLVTDAEAQTRFEREARAGASLEHDHIVTTYDVGFHDGCPFLAVAFIEGETLAERIQQQGRLSPEDTVALLAPIAEALAYAHRKDVIHRDVKSNNIMIRAEDQRPVLIDFGIAQASFTHKLTRRGDALGTPEYMSPEQASAQAIDHRSDLYSLGVVLYECLTGTLPFESPNTEVLLANIKHEPHRPVAEVAPGIPATLSAVVDRCLAKRPEDRYADGAALAEALRAARAASPARKRHLRRAWVLGGLLITVLAFGGFAYNAGWFGSVAGMQQGLLSPPEDSLFVEDDDSLQTRNEDSLQTETPSAPRLETLLAEAETAYEAQNYGNAFALFTQAAEQGSAEAQFRLGLMYRDGEGVAADTTAARQWLRRAAEQGHTEAEQTLAQQTQPPDDEAATTPPGPPVSEQEEAELDVYSFVDQPPELIGGNAALIEKIRYPEAARSAGIRGSVAVRFIVDTQGNVVSPRVVQGIGFGCDEEALRVVRQARFKPGIHGGKPVKVWRTMRIRFGTN